MQLLLVSAIIEEARQSAKWGWINGITTKFTVLSQMMHHDLSKATLDEFKRSESGLLI